MREALRREVESLLSHSDVLFLSFNARGVFLDDPQDQRLVDLTCHHISCVLPIRATYSARENFITLEEK